MHYKELLYNRDKVLSFFPELAVIFNKFDELNAKQEEQNTGKYKKPYGNGLNKAIFINQLNYWLEINEKVNKNFRDGHYWVYNSYESWAENDFQYWSPDTIKRIVSSLENTGVIISANYNKLKIDKTKWYRIDYKRLQEIIDIVSDSGDEGLEKKQVAPLGNADCGYVRADCTNDKGSLNKPLPENTTDITNRNYNKNTLSGERAVSECENHQPDNPKPTNRKKEANELFERLWSLYPLKKGKGSVSDTQKLKLLDIGYEELERAISRYIRYVDGIDYLHYKNGSTFFNSGYIDYLDDNYTDSNSGEYKQASTLESDSSGMKKELDRPESPKNENKHKIEDYKKYDASEIDQSEFKKIIHEAIVELGSDSFWDNQEENVENCINYFIDRYAEATGEKHPVLKIHEVKNIIFDFTSYVFTDEKRERRRCFFLVSEEKGDRHYERVIDMYFSTHADSGKSVTLTDFDSGTIIGDMMELDDRDYWRVIE